MSRFVNAVFSFLIDDDRRNRLIKFVNLKHWQPSSNSVVCKKHFEYKYLKNVNRIRDIA